MMTSEDEALPRYLFVGEQRSDRAVAMNVTWRDGRLAAKQLFDALRVIGLQPEQHAYLNWFELKQPARAVRSRCRGGYIIVAMGNKVAQAMLDARIPHIKIVHPAARGLIRRKDRYAAHLREVLSF